MATATQPSMDWQTGKTLSECFDHLLASNIASDVTFLVGRDKKRISAHKLVLISRSPVFYAMFEGPMAEKGEVIVPDISEDTFQLFLRYLYTDKIDLANRNVVPVLNAARKYCVDILLWTCEGFLKTNLTVGTACQFLEQAHVFVMDSLKSDCLRFINEHPTVVLQSEAFTELCLGCVTSITEADDIRVTENIVYEAIIRWSEAECARQNLEATANNKREVLGDTLYTVRYHHVDEEFLLGKLCADKVLKSDDLVDIINHTRNKIPLISGYLDSTKDVRYKQNFHRVYRNGPVSNQVWLGIPEDDGISFKTSANMYLHGFGSFHTGDEPSIVDLKVFEGHVCISQSTKTLTTPQHAEPHTGDVELDQPIKIHAGKMYTIIERSNKSKCYYFLNGKSTATHQHVTIEFRDSEKSRCTNTNRGQIPYLLLSL